MRLFLMTSMLMGLLFLTNFSYAEETNPKHILATPHIPLVLEPVVERDWNYRGSPWDNSGTKPWLWAPNDFGARTIP